MESGQEYGGAGGIRDQLQPGQYSSFIRNFAYQPPFATTATNVSPYGNFLTLENGFPTSPEPLVTNNYSLDPNYRLAYVQIWNLDIQRQLPGNVQLNVGYNGAKGTRLDTERALVPSCAATDTCSTSSSKLPHHSFMNRPRAIRS